MAEIFKIQLFWEPETCEGLAWVTYPQWQREPNPQPKFPSFPQIQIFFSYNQLIHCERWFQIHKIKFKLHEWLQLHSSTFSNIKNFNFPFKNELRFTTGRVRGAGECFPKSWNSTVFFSSERKFVGFFFLETKPKCTPELKPNYFHSSHTTLATVPSFLFSTPGTSSITTGGCMCACSPACSFLSICRAASYLYELWVKSRAGQKISTRTVLLKKTFR